MFLFRWRSRFKTSAGFSRPRRSRWPADRISISWQEAKEPWVLRCRQRHAGDKPRGFELLVSGKWIAWRADSFVIRKCSAGESLFAFDNNRVERLKQDRTLDQMCSNSADHSAVKTNFYRFRASEISRRLKRRCRLLLPFDISFNHRRTTKFIQ